MFGHQRLDQVVRLGARVGEADGDSRVLEFASHAVRSVQRIEDDCAASTFVWAEAASQKEDQSLSLPLEIARSILRPRQPCRMQQVVTIDDEERRRHDAHRLRQS